MNPWLLFLFIPLALAVVFFLAYLMRGRCCDECDTPLELDFSGYFYDDLVCPSCGKQFRVWHEKHRGG